MQRRTTTTRRARAGWLAVLAVAACSAAVVPAAADDTPGASTDPATTALDDARVRRDAVRRERADVAATLDVLGADRAELVAALDALDADADAEAAALEAASAAAEEARVAAGRAGVELADADAALDDLRAQVRDLAVDAYIGEPGAAGDLAAFVGAADVVDAAKAVLLADLEVERRDAIVDRLADVRAAREAAAASATRAAAHAAAVRDEVAPRAAAAAEARDRHAAFLVVLEGEVERRLAEASSLEALDVQLADEVRRGEEALAARLRAEAEAAALAAAQAAAARPIASRPSTPAVPPSGQLVRVGEIVVDASLGQALASLLGAAHADGVALGGGGYRDAAGQIARRADNCGPTPYDLYEKPASLCAPPTARPGHSMHERGLAVDFTNAGVLIGRRDDPGYVWLAANAGRFGFRNLPSEPWHWSTTGE